MCQASRPDDNQISNQKKYYEYEYLLQSVSGHWLSLKCFYLFSFWLILAVVSDSRVIILKFEFFWGHLEPRRKWMRFKHDYSEIAIAICCLFLFLTGLRFLSCFFPWASAKMLFADKVHAEIKIRKQTAKKKTRKNRKKNIKSQAKTQRENR